MSEDGLRVAATALLLLAVVLPVITYRLGYRRGARLEGILWRKAPEHVLRAEAAAARGAGRARVRRADIRPTARDRNLE